MTMKKKLLTGVGIVALAWGGMLYLQYGSGRTTPGSQLEPGFFETNRIGQEQVVTQTPAPTATVQNAYEDVDLTLSPEEFLARRAAGTLTPSINVSSTTSPQAVQNADEDVDLTLSPEEFLAKRLGRSENIGQQAEAGVVQTQESRPQALTPEEIIRRAKESLRQAKEAAKEAQPVIEQEPAPQEKAPTLKELGQMMERDRKAVEGINALFSETFGFEMPQGASFGVRLNAEGEYEVIGDVQNPGDAATQAIINAAPKSQDWLDQAGNVISDLIPSKEATADFFTSVGQSLESGWNWTVDAGKSLGKGTVELGDQALTWTGRQLGLVEEPKTQTVEVMLPSGIVMPLKVQKTEAEKAPTMTQQLASADQVKTEEKVADASAAVEKETKAQETTFADDVKELGENVLHRATTAEGWQKNIDDIGDGVKSGWNWIAHQLTPTDKTNAEEKVADASAAVEKETKAQETTFADDVKELGENVLHRTTTAEGWQKNAEDLKEVANTAIDRTITVDGWKKNIQDVGDGLNWLGKQVGLVKEASEQPVQENKTAQAGYTYVGGKDAQNINITIDATKPKAQKAPASQPEKETKAPSVTAAEQIPEPTSLADFLKSKGLSDADVQKAVRLAQKEMAGKEQARPSYSFTGRGLGLTDEAKNVSTGTLKQHLADTSKTSAVQTALLNKVKGQNGNG